MTRLLPQDLSERSREILRVVVEDYIRASEPIGSRTVARRCGLGLSPATIRNAMANLVEMGLLFQPHTSAGRLPTESGFRYFVDFLLEREDLSPGGQRAIEKGLMEFPSDLAGTLQRAVKLLANASGHAAVVSAPRLTGEHLHHIEFVRLRAGLVLIIFVLQSGLIQNRLVQIHKDLPNDRLQLLARYLNSKLEGLGLEEARKAILEDMEEERRSFDILWGESFGRSLVG